MTPGSMLPFLLMPPDALYRFAPELAGRLPAEPLGRFPTPVKRAGGLSRETGAEIWLKCDDTSSGLYGGNKVRKLELVFPEVFRRGLKRIVTGGGWGSHHVLATAAFARSFGIGTTGYVMPQPLTPHVVEVQRLLHSFGADIVPVSGPAEMAARIAAEAGRTFLPGNRTYVLVPGGSTPLTVLAYAGAALELVGQAKAGECPLPSDVFVAAGSGGTAAGLLLGFHLAEADVNVRAVQVVERPLSNPYVVWLLAEAGHRKLQSLTGRPLPPVSRARLRFETGYLGRCYGDPTAASREAVRRAGESEGLSLETTYTGKTLAALLHRARGCKGPAMFWNTYSSADMSGGLAAVPETALPDPVRSLFAQAGPGNG
ncbi:MAG: pyridoxal-phosphate dependent enzyme [Deltaproteobacteria bacterium]|nr:pyridoxal-phosphate dependent enzyme [Deltaproteobacteria bacterium]